MFTRQLEALTYQRVFHRIRAEYLAMPTTTLGLEQVYQLSRGDPTTCGSVLDALVRAKFLQRHSDGTYTRVYPDATPMAE